MAVDTSPKQPNGLDGVWKTKHSICDPKLQFSYLVDLNRMVLKFIHLNI